jgi:hypothetical protein
LETTIPLLIGSHTPIIIQVPVDNSIYLVVATLVGATVFMAFVTRSHAKHTAMILGETRNTVKEMKRATEAQFAPWLFTTFNTTTGRALTLTTRNIWSGSAKEIKIIISVNGKKKEEDYIQLLQKGESKQHFIDAGDAKSDASGFDNQRTIDFYKKTRQL